MYHSVGPLISSLLCSQDQRKRERNRAQFGLKSRIFSEENESKKIDKRYRQENDVPMFPYSHPQDSAVPIAVAGHLR